LSKIHLNDNSQEPRKDQPGYDKLYKIKSYLDNLSEAYVHYFPTKHQSIDENMVKFLGRNNMKQYMPMKPIKKSTNSGFELIKTAMYANFKCTRESLVNQLKNVSGKELSQSLVDKNYQLYFDNYFSSANLINSLLRDKIFACATVRKDRVGLAKIQIKDKDLKPGDNEFRTSNEDVMGKMDGQEASTSFI